jgi:hypothetical protein
VVDDHGRVGVPVTVDDGVPAVLGGGRAGMVAQDWPTTYKAEYLAVTRLQADALVTIDPGLAAKAQGVVPLANLSNLLVG